MIPRTTILLALMGCLLSVGCETTKVERRYSEETTTVDDPAQPPREGDRRPGRTEPQKQTSDPKIIIE